MFDRSKALKVDVSNDVSWRSLENLAKMAKRLRQVI